MSQFAKAVLSATLLSSLPFALHAAQAPAPPPPAAQSVDRAISKVYPALVQIRVLTVDHGSGRARKFEASGSGVIISPDGYVVTNHHVAGRAVSMRVTLSTKEELEATLVGTDPLSDIAVLKLDLSSRRAGAPALPSASWGSSSALKIGDTVLAMGCPLALSQSVTEGIVANKDMMLPRMFSGRFMLDGEDVGSLVKWIGHDAAIQPGNSGGPLVDTAGDVVGINEIGLGSMSGAIPSDLAKVVAQELVAKGKVKRAWIGADFQPLLKEAAQSPDAKGILVAGVIAGSPAESAGLRAGDIVLALDGAPVSARFREELPAFNLMLLGKPVGPPVKFTVLREKKELTLEVKTDPREEAEGKPTEVLEWGISVEPVTQAIRQELQRPDNKGVLIQGVRSGGPSDQAVPSLQSHDLILEVGGTPVADVAAFLAKTKQIAPPGATPVPTLVLVERRTEKLLTLVEVGVRTPQEPASEVRKAWLPVSTQVLTKKLAAAMGLKGKRGVRITQVFPQSSAEAAGFKVGDVVTHIDGVLIEASEPHDSDVFDGMIRQYKLGKAAEFTVIRDGKPMSLTVTLDEGPKPDREMRVYADEQLEFRARDVSLFDRVRSRWDQKQGGALVSQVEEGGWAAVGGLRTDDLILGVDGKTVAQLNDLQSGLKTARESKEKRVVLLVRRGVHTLFVELEPKWM